MNLSLIALFFWLLVANVAAMVPSKDNHWRLAYRLMALGVPLLGWLLWENPWWLACGIRMALDQAAGGQGRVG